MSELADQKPLRLLHVIEQLSGGGAARSLSALVCELQKNPNIQQSILSLLPSDSKVEGVEVIAGGSITEWHALCKDFDIVQIYFWNSPVLNDFLCSCPPFKRCVLWLMVSCTHAPQVLFSHAVNLADCVVASCALTPSLGDEVVDKTIMTACDFSRLDSYAPVTHDGFTIGYIGTVDRIKMHPHYVEMSAQVEIPNAQFLVYGSGAGFPGLKKKAHALGVEDRFSFCGYVHDIAAAFSQFDLFGYPLCEENYATSDLVIQEALYCGVPPVVFSYGGVATIIDHDKTGLIVNSAAEYAEALEFLFHNPHERFRMGELGREYARTQLGAERVATQFCDLYDELLTSTQLAKVENIDCSVQCIPQLGAERFVQSLGASTASFVISLSSSDRELVQRADTLIADAGPVLASASSGGVLDYARYYPNDPHLHLWSGLILESQGRYALALGEYRIAQKVGLDEERVMEYAQRCAAKAQLPDLVNMYTEQRRAYRLELETA